jgi:hypothetical protein
MNNDNIVNRDRWRRRIRAFFQIQAQDKKRHAIKHADGTQDQREVRRHFSHDPIVEYNAVDQADSAAPGFGYRRSGRLDLRCVRRMRRC